MGEAAHGGGDCPGGVGVAIDDALTCYCGAFSSPLCGQGLGVGVERSVAAVDASNRASPPPSPVRIAAGCSFDESVPSRQAPLHHPSLATLLGRSPSPARGGVKQRISVLAMRLFRIRALSKARTGPPAKGGGAPKGAGRLPRPLKQASPPALVSPRRALLLGSALASRRSTAALAKGLSAKAQSGPALHGSGQPIRSPGSQLLADRRRGRPGEFPNRPNAVCEPAPGHRARSTFRIASGMCPSMSERRRFDLTLEACQATSSRCGLRLDFARLFASGGCLPGQRASPRSTRFKESSKRAGNDA